MCGITGWFNYSKSNIPGSEALLRKMCSVITHRGPDDEGLRLSSGAALGIRRLAVIDLKTGSQPIHNEDSSLWVVCNGEIYNFQELTETLKKRGHRFYTKSDVEVIVHLYEEYGTALLPHLRGMFAFALFDEKKNLFFAARDRLGKKPFTYALCGGSLVFGSEIKSILEFPGIKREVNYNAIHHYLTYQYVPSPLSAFEGIHKLPPASSLIRGSSGKVTIERYWQPDFRNKLNYTAAEWEEALLNKLEESTRIRMVSDVPLGAFLSGGVDSSAVVAMMARNSSQPVKTFSIGFAEQDFSELKFAAVVAKKFGTDHREFIVKPETAEILPKLAWHYGEPFADSSALPSYFVARETRKHVTVALNGDGGDESFAGYLRYKAFRFSEMTAPVNKFIYAIGSPLSRHLLKYSSGPVRKYLNYALRVSSALSQPPARRNIRWHSIFDNEAKNAIYSEAMINRFDGNDAFKYLEDIFNGAPAQNNTDRLLYTDLSAYLPECLLVKMDIASMANSLEARSPFLDHELVELAARMPPELKLKGLNGKYILKKSLKGILPAEILSRKKMGFGIPVNSWFRNELRAYLKDTVLSEKALARGYFKKDALEKLIAEHDSGRAEHGYRLWDLLMLELWHREFID